jgi:hypothetical protein
MKRALLIGALLGLAACGGPEVTYNPAPQLLPHHIGNIAVRTFKNNTQQFGLEDRLTLTVIDAFLADGDYNVVPENEADGVVVGTLTRYILTPLTFDTNLVPTTYKLQVYFDLQFIDRQKNQILWEEPNFVEHLRFTAPTLPGGITEEQARENTWTMIANDTVKRVVQGYGTVTGKSERMEPPTTGEGTPPLPSPPLQEQPH